MTKAFKFYAAIWAVSLIVFNFAAFICCAKVNMITGSFWIGYIFIVLAFIGQLAAIYIAFKAENAQKMFYNMSLFTISCISLAAMLMFGVMCMVIPLFPLWLGASLCIIITGISTVINMTAYCAAKTAASMDNEINAKTYTIKTLTSQAEHLMASAKSDEIKSACKKAYEALRYSDPMSNTALSELNEQLQCQFKAFEDAVFSEDFELLSSVLCDLLDLIDKRNKKCKLLK